MINLAAESVAANPTLLDKVMSLFNPIPESYHFIVYFAVLFIVCVSFKFLIDFLKIIFSMIFSKGGF